MHRQIVVLIFLLSLTTVATAKPAVTEMPITFQNGVVIVDATIKDNVPVRMALATGGEYSFTDPSLLEKYNLRASYAADGPVTGRNDKTYTFTMVSVRVGDSKSKNLNLRFGSMAALTKLAGQEIFGTLGVDFFEGQIIQFDLKNKVMRFIEKTPVDLVDKNGDPAAGNTIVLRMAPKPTSAFQKTYQMPLVRDVLFNGQKANVMFDTGMATAIAVSSSAAKKIGLTVPADTARAEKLTLRLEPQEFTNVPAWIYAKGTGADELLSKHGVVAGSYLLQEFVALFDYKKGVIILERSK